MASIIKQAHFHTAAPTLWAQVRAFGKLDALFPDMLTCTQQDDVRTLTFNAGPVITERIIATDDAAMRLSYTILGDALAHHNASMQVVAAHDGCAFIWITDVLPDDAAPSLTPLIDALWATLPGKA